MAAAAVIAVVVAVGELSSPATIALRLAAEESLGAAAVVHVIEARNLRTIDPAAIEKSFDAGAVAVVAWRDRAHQHAVVRIHVSEATGWTTRAFAFSRRDSLLERGRTLGLAISSAWPGGPPPGAPESEASSPATQPVDGDRGSPSVTGPSAVPSPPGGERPAAAADRPSTLPPERAIAAPAALASTTGGAPRSAMRDRRSFWVGAATVASVGLGGPASALGGLVEAGLPLSRTFALRLGGEWRSGPVAALDGTDRVAVAAGGFEWWPGPPRRVGLGGRGDLLLLRHAVTGNAMGVTETETRLQAGADIMAGARVRLGSKFELSFGVGLELAFGSTELRTGPTSTVVAIIPALRAISHIGLRVGF